MYTLAISSSVRFDTMAMCRGENDKREEMHVYIECGIGIHIVLVPIIESQPHTALLNVMYDIQFNFNSNSKINIY